MSPSNYLAAIPRDPASGILTPQTDAHWRAVFAAAGVEYVEDDATITTPEPT